MKCQVNYDCRDYSCPAGEHPFCGSYESYHHCSCAIGQASGGCSLVGGLALDPLPVVALLIVALFRLRRVRTPGPLMVAGLMTTRRKPNPARPCCRRCEHTAPTAIVCPAVFSDGHPAGLFARAAEAEVRRQIG